MRFIGLDLGTKSLGIALSDKTNLIATPFQTLHFPSGQYDLVLSELFQIIKENDITDIVLGLPKNMNNTQGFASKRSLDFKTLLEKNGNYPIHLIDERLSTVEATNLLIKNDVKRKKRKSVIDNVAAAIILDTFLKEKRTNHE